MKKGIVSFLLVILMLFSGSVTAYAAPYRGAETVVYETDYEAMRQAIIAGCGEEEYLKYKEDIEKGIQIQILFDKLGRLDLDMHVEETHLRETETDEEVIAAGMERIREEYQKKSEKCEEELAKLGVIKVEPTNSKHMEMLTTMQNGMLLETNGFSALANGGVPDFNLIALSVLGIAALISLCLRKRKAFAEEM